MLLEWNNQALTDLHYWAAASQKKARSILQLLEEITTSPFTSSGKPQALSHLLAGCWSRRIDPEHRLVYRVEEQRIVILACRYHY